MKAPDFLQAGLKHMQDRAATYDNPEGERSMKNTVAAFNALTGLSLTEQQGWLFMCCLKMARTQQGAFRADNYEDLAAYAGLMGESAAQEAVRLPASKEYVVVPSFEPGGYVRDLTDMLRHSEKLKAVTRFADIHDCPDPALDRAKEKVLSNWRSVHAIMSKLGWGEVVNNEVPQGYRVFQTIDGTWWCAPSKAADPPEEFRYRNEDKL